MLSAKRARTHTLTHTESNPVITTSVYTTPRLQCHICCGIAHTESNPVITTSVYAIPRLQCHICCGIAHTESNPVITTSVYTTPHLQCNTRWFKYNRDWFFCNHNCQTLTCTHLRSQRIFFQPSGSILMPVWKKACGWRRIHSRTVWMTASLSANRMPCKSYLNVPNR